MTGYEYFDHTADIGLRVWGDSFESLLANAASGLANLIVPCEQVQVHIWQTFQVSGDEPALVLFDLLSELIYRFEEERLAIREVQVAALGPGQWQARVGGEPFDPLRHATGNEVKAVTYHRLRVEEQQGQWQGEVVFDI